MQKCIHAYMYVYMCICMYVYIHTYSPPAPTTPELTLRSFCQVSKICFVFAKSIGSCERKHTTIARFAVVIRSVYVAFCTVPW